MRTIWTFVFLLASVSLWAQSDVELAQELRVDNIEIKQMDGKNYLKVSFVGEGQQFVERPISYPKVTAEIDGKVVAEGDIRYLLMQSELLQTDLNDLPVGKTIIIKISILHHEDEVVEMEYTVPDTKNTRFIVEYIEHITVDNKHFLKLTINDTKEGGILSYPAIKVVMDGKVIAQRSATTYGLVKTELVPTELTKLPASYSCTVHLAKMNFDDPSQVYKATYEGK